MNPEVGATVVATLPRHALLTCVKQLTMPTVIHALHTNPMLLKYSRLPFHFGLHSVSCILQLPANPGRLQSYLMWCVGGPTTDKQPRGTHLHIPDLICMDCPLHR